MPQATKARRDVLLRTLVALAVLVALFYLVYFACGMPLGNAREEWRKGANADAMRTLEKWGDLGLRRVDYDNLRAVVYLTLGKREEAKPFLDRLAGTGSHWLPVIRKDEVGSRLISAGRYEEFLQYDTAFHYRGESADATLYRAAAQLGTGRLAEAETTLATIDPAEADAGKYAALRSAINERKRGSFALVFDRAGKTIAAYQIENADLVTINGDFAALIEKDAGAFTLESHLGRLGTARTLQTTLDSTVQKAAMTSLGGLRGSMVVIDVAANELLAVANSAGRGPLRNLAFEAEYEPGSVIKVLTALSAFDDQIDIDAMFPLDCRGFLVLNARQFFDWAKHDRIADLGEAMAVSCNVAFGRIGLRLGADRLRSFMRKAGFNGAADLAVYRVPLGRSVGDLPNEYAIASYAVGLEKQRINTLHVAMLASMVANKGQLAAPRLLLGGQSILGEPVAQPAAPPPIAVASEGAVQRVLPTLRAVVEHPRGTGRRAEISGISIAMKTGTAGHASKGYDALIMAFAPADAPRIAIGVIAEDAGPAEFAGAKIAYDFFSKVRSRIQQ